MQKEKVELDAQVEKNLAKARNEADKIIADAQAEAKSTVEQSEQNAKTKAKAILDDANTKIKQDTLLARKKLEKELIGLIGDATEAIIDEKVDPKKDAALIDKAIKAQQ
jgi:F-type H+-transporting ATPase subunit b